MNNTSTKKHHVKEQPSGSVAQFAECSHGKREALGSSPGWATIFSSPVICGGQCGYRADNANVVGSRL